MDKIAAIVVGSVNAILEKRGLKRKDLARLMKVSSPSITSMLSGAWMRTTTIEKIAKALGVDPLELLKGQPAEDRPNGRKKRK
jgi:transcriptional regulator with XRE-family HTH domain